MKILHRLLCSLLMLGIICLPVTPAHAGIYTVQPGDSLFSISVKYGTTIHNLMKVNQLDSTLIKPGQQLKVPDKNTTAQPRGYVVMPGDTLYQIALQFHISTQTLIAANNLSQTIIYPGQVLKVPARTSTASRGGARPAIPYTKEDLDLLARLITAESRGEPELGKISVGAVVINRVKSPKYPNTIKEVIYQPGQFGPVRSGRINNPALPDCIEAAKKALNGADPTGGALYFFDNKTGNRFLRSLPVALKQGNLIFAYPK
ncbi:LysM repeat protein [Desulfohalotomaculum tongense]|uniref:cell wall hydrolase n=1 Tax=Desulforadius tongensis TaxID=1216062 RepID=UPI001957AD87|nr:cell wall hydrolase [Desulforadius tongensis]MBM7854816.1 LysM repeat protein [Desulforadius tongensis]